MMIIPDQLGMHPTEKITVCKLITSPTKRKNVKIEIVEKGKARFVRHNQTDSGANTSATNDITIIWFYEDFTEPIPLTTYSHDSESDEGTTCYAYGKGIVRLILKDKSIIEFPVLYVPSATGTVLSPQHFMETHPEVDEWRQIATRTRGGALEFYNSQQELLASLELRPERGLWYTTNLTYVKKEMDQRANVNSLMIPPIEEIKDPPGSTQYTTAVAISDKVGTTCDPPDRILMLTSQTTWTPTEAVVNQLEKTTDRAFKEQEKQGKLAKAIKDMELWHQRMGHPHPRTLKETYKHVEGMPNFPADNSFFHCPFCDKAKLRKQNRNLKTTREQFLPGASYHMDFAFVSGHENLQEMVNKGMRSKGNLKPDRKGNTCYLIIICAATKYVWTFPLKSKHPPTKIIDKFLKKHGQAHGRTTTTVTTSPNGVLARSKSFKTIIRKNKMILGEKDLEIDLNNGDPADIDKTATNGAETITEKDDLKVGSNVHRYIIRTDQGKELGESTGVQQVALEHGYNVETTGSDSSSAMNGMVERPNRTLKERLRCLLYTAGLGTEFWSDALLHAVWLYNRTYHKGIDKTPFEAWTGRRPTVDHIITFGTKLTAKAPGSRKAALDPHHYDGIFLGYTGTDTKLRYWDIHNNNEKSAHHVTEDELHYGADPKGRPPAARHLLQVFTGTPHEERQTHQLLEQPKLTEVTKEILLQTEDQIIKDSPVSYTSRRINKIQLRRDDKDLVENIRSLDVTLNLCDPAISETIPLHDSPHPTCGLDIQSHQEYENTVFLNNIIPGTTASNTIRRWKSRLRYSIVTMVDDITITSPSQFKEVIATMRKKKRHHAEKITIQFAKPRWANMNGEGVPSLAFDQLNVIAHHLSTMKSNEPSWTDSYWPDVRDQDLDSIVRKGLALPKLTRRKLKAGNPEEWKKFRESEWTQLDKYNRQEMFGKPIRKPRNRDAVILPWVWSYVYKTDPITMEKVAKSRGTCNGGTKFGKIVTLAETYAACVEQHAHRLFWAIVASENFICRGADVGNAFAEADGPKETFYMQADEVFRDWWTNHLGKPPLPPNFVIPIRKNLQGHPEGPRLWNKHIDEIMVNKMHFQQTTHEPCLYYKRDPTTGKLIIMLRQVDDFLIAGSTQEECDNIRAEIQTYMKNKLNDLDTVRLYNGVDIDQTRRYVKLSCETYIDKIMKHHGWENEHAANVPIPMRADSKYLRDIQEAEGPEDEKEQQYLQETMGFSYRQCIGELIYAMSTCRVDIAAAVIQLSQYSAQPAKIHYEAVKRIFVYLNATKDYGLHYWRDQPRMDLPEKADPIPVTNLSRLQEFPDKHDAKTLHGSTDATWAADRNHRRSVSGSALLFAGSVVYYRCQIQPTIALSSSESEFAAMADTGKAALYMRSILNEIGLLQNEPTELQADNTGAIALANAQQPTRRTKHIDIKQMAILQWTDEDKLTFEPIKTEFNTSDSLTKPLGSTKFYEQNDILMGRRLPNYSSQITLNSLFSTHRIFDILRVSTLEDYLDV